MPILVPAEHVRKRIVLHFPGFEPLNAEKHRGRYERSLARAADLWGFKALAGPLNCRAVGGYFDVSSEGAGWQTWSRIHIFDHNDIVERLNSRTLLRRLSGGFRSALHVVLEGGAGGYFKQAWRFGLFFLFPFLLVFLAAVASLAVAAYPFWLGFDVWHFPLSLTIAYLVFFRIFLPWSGRLYVLHLFSDWEMALHVARLDDHALLDWLERCAENTWLILHQDADEFVISSHSMGSSVVVHVIGMLLERQPDLLRDKQVQFVTLGGAVLQCALLRCAKDLRARVGIIARTSEISWVDVQCLTDVISFYKTKVVSLCGHPALPQARIIFIRIKKMLSPERYRRIKWDLLRVHRQYVLDADHQTPFDFFLLTAGPRPARSFGNDAGLGTDSEALISLLASGKQTIARD
ncbi:hypothetical protein JNB84_22535 [Rhizobium pusense]|uniref:hypothetical protein n=1 Tax=Agrobacterium pusense TaxID=648995 RepID=UPI001C6F091C|nr:hypothetical protein [Agrobacterium pusense]MBW9080743.1 hypothetical protein [Agrobacterium pusense]